MSARPQGLEQPDVTAEELLLQPQPQAHPLAAWVSARWRTPLLRATSLLETRDGAGTVIILALAIKCALVAMTTDVPTPHTRPLTGP